jgi:phosphonate transport system ATP-binding protein
MIELERVTKVFPRGTRALTSVSMHVKPGEAVVLLGRSGAGKSTLLRCVNGFVQPTYGRTLGEVTTFVPVSDATYDVIRETAPLLNLDLKKIAD